MKNLFPLIVLCLLSSCLSPRVNTEKFIKTTIEQHTPNNYSEILTNTFYKGSVKGGYLELFVVSMIHRTILLFLLTNLLLKTSQITSRHMEKI